MVVVGPSLVVVGILPTAVAAVAAVAVTVGAQRGRKAKIPDAHETGLEN